MARAIQLAKTDLSEEDRLEAAAAVRWTGAEGKAKDDLGRHFAAESPAEAEQARPEEQKRAWFGVVELFVAAVTETKPPALSWLTVKLLAFSRSMVPELF